MMAYAACGGGWGDASSRWMGVRQAALGIAEDGEAETEDDAAWHCTSTDIGTSTGMTL